MKSLLLIAALMGGGWGEPAAWDLWGSPSVSFSQAMRLEAAAQPEIRSRAILRITAVRRDRLARSLAALRRAGWSISAFDSAQIQILETRGTEDMSYWDRTGRRVRELRPGCGDPIDQWTIGWLATGEYRRPEPKRVAVTVVTTGNYPVHGQWYTVDDEDRPSRKKLIRHLRGRNHRDAFRGYAIEDWSYAELMSAHSDHHRLGRLRGVLRSSRRRSSRDARAEVRTSRSLTVLGLPVIGGSRSVGVTDRGELQDRSDLRILGIPLFGTRSRGRLSASSRRARNYCPD